MLATPAHLESGCFGKDTITRSKTLVCEQALGFQLQEHDSQGLGRAEGMLPMGKHSVMGDIRG